MAYGKALWQEIRSLYEDPETPTTIKYLSEKFGPSMTMIVKRSKNEQWFNPKKAKAKAKEVIKERNRQMEEDLAVQLADEYEEMRRENFSMARKSLNDFAKLEPVPKDYHEAVKAVQIAREAAGVQDNAPKIGISIGLLSSQVTDADVVDV